MEFVFQTGEFYSEGSDWLGFLGNLLGAFVGAILSGIIAIWTFKEGIKAQNNKEIEKETNRIRLKGKTFFALINRIVSNSKRQVEEFETYINKIKANPLIEAAPLFLTHQDVSIPKIGTV